MNNRLSPSALTLVWEASIESAINETLTEPTFEEKEEALALLSPYDDFLTGKTSLKRSALLVFNALQHNRRK